MGLIIQNQWCKIIAGNVTVEDRNVLHFEKIFKTIFTTYLSVSIIYLNSVHDNYWGTSKEAFVFCFSESIKSDFCFIIYTREIICFSYHNLSCASEILFYNLHKRKLHKVYNLEKGNLFANLGSVIFFCCIWNLVISITCWCGNIHEQIPEI